MDLRAEDREFDFCRRADFGFCGTARRAGVVTFLRFDFLILRRVEDTIDMVDS
jgi:hypothetical protein